MPHEQHHRWYSPNLSRDIDVLAYGDRGYPVILFPTSKGRYFESKDFKLIDSAEWFLDNGLIKIYCPDSIDADSWYNRGIDPGLRVRNHIWYDLMILRELVPLVQRETGVGRVATAGCSFGGYHATNFGFKHPEVVKFIINMGAVFDIKGQLDGYYDDNVYFNNPRFYSKRSKPFFVDLHTVLGTGTADMCWDANEKMAAILREKKMSHWLDVRSSATHDWPTWCEMFPHYLSMIK